MHSLTRRANGPLGLALAAIALVGLVVGCGGSRHASSSNPGTGSAVINIEWPPRETGEGRVIPAATESLVIRVFTDQELTHLRKVIPRPTSAGSLAVRFDNLPLGPVLFVAEAHSDTAGESQPPLASGAQTVNIVPDQPVDVVITLTTDGTGSGAVDTGFVTVTVTGIPLPAPGVTETITVQVVRDGQMLSGDGAERSFQLNSGMQVTAVPLRLGPLPSGSLLFVATANDGTRTVASGSTIGQVSPTQETSIAVPMVMGTGGSTGGAPSQGDQPTTAAAIVTVNNIAIGDSRVIVDPLPGDRNLSDPDPLTVALPNSVVQQGVSVRSVPVLVAGLSPGPWLFIVTTEKADGTLSRAGSSVADLKAGDRQALEVSLGSAQSTAPPKPEGELNVRTTNIAGEGIQFVLVAVFDSTGRVAETRITHAPGVTERLATFPLAGGPYTVVSAAYGGPDFDAAGFEAALANTTTIPIGSMAIGSTTVNVESGQSSEATVELRLQGATGSGSVNLAMRQVPLLVKETQIGETMMTQLEILSSIVVRVFSVSNNQELPALRRVIVPPSGTFTGAPGDLLIRNPYDQLGPMRLRLDGVPVGDMRFEVYAVANNTGAEGPIMGSGSTIAPISTGVNAVTVFVLPHGTLPNTLPDGSSVLIPGSGNDDPDGQNPDRSRSRVVQDAIARFRAGLAKRR